MSKKIKRHDNQDMRNMVIGLIAVLGLIFLGLYFSKWKQVKDEEKYLQSYLVTTDTVHFEINKLDQIKYSLSEIPNQYFVLVSYTKDKDTYKFEKSLKPIIDEYQLQDNIYYLNITKIKESEKDYQEKIAKELEIDKNNLNEIPVIFYFKDNKLEKVLHSDNELKDLLESMKKED